MNKPPTRRIAQGVTLTLFTLLLCGCFDVKDELTLRPDGTGSVLLKVRTVGSSDLLDTLTTAMQMGREDRTPGIYPPTKAEEAERFFPSKLFKIKKRVEESEGRSVLIFEATFDRIDDLLASPYAAAHQLSVTRDAGAVRLRGTSGIETAAHFAEVNPADLGGFFPLPLPRNGGDTNVPGMRTEWRVTLPNPLTTSSEGIRDGKSLTLVVDRTAAKDSAAFLKSTLAVLEAACPDPGVTFTPAAPPRLALGSFATVLAASTASKAALPDEKAVAASMKFTPHAIQIVRTVDLSGDGGGGGENVAKMFGTVSLPRSMEPRKWGRVELKQVTDAKGASLKKSRSRDESFEVQDMALEDDMGGDEPGTAENEKAAASNEVQHLVTVSFQPPDRKVKELGRIEASLALHYEGGSRVIKLTNAIPSKWITDAKGMRQMMFAGGDDRTLKDPQLDEVRLPLQVMSVSSQGNLTLLMMTVEGQQASGEIVTGQVYDADGKPWPTVLQSQGGPGRGMVMLVVPGKPAPPLSLAFNVNLMGATVNLPILVEHVPLKAP